MVHNCSSLHKDFKTHGFLQKHTHTKKNYHKSGIRKIVGNVFRFRLKRGGIGRPPSIRKGIIFIILFVSVWSLSDGNCTDLGCMDCIKEHDCVWCDNITKCFSINDYVHNENCTDHGFCLGPSCEHVCVPVKNCPIWIFPCSEGKWQLGADIVLMILYGAVLAFAAKMISDGSEMLLCVFNPGIIGGFVLPVLGAVPDCAIILFSGIGGTKEEAEVQIQVGMGTLAGSTIMLMTIPFGLGICLAQCDIGEDGKSIDNQSTGWNFFKKGVTWGYDVAVNAILAVVTSLSYFIVQGIAFYYLAHPNIEVNEPLERWVSFGAMFVCLAFFVAFSVYQVLNTRFQSLITKRARDKQKVNEVVGKLQVLVKRTHLREKVRVEKDENREEYRRRIALKYGRIWREKARKSAALKQKQAKEDEKKPLIKKKEEKKHEEEEEYAGWPKWKILLKSGMLMCVGVGLVTFFSDPMVDVITDFGEAINVPSFFVSFVVTPICSNASELIASLIFAAKKKRVNNTIAFAQLYGAAIMNNTLCLAIFYFLVFLRRLKWSFSAETLTIFISTLAMGTIGALSFLTKLTLRVWIVVFVLAIYPVSLGFICALQYGAGWD